MSDGHVHINRPRITGYLARVRRPGHRKYERVGSIRKSKRSAMVALAQEFAKGIYKRGDVIAFDACPYYEPMFICEIVRK